MRSLKTILEMARITKAMIKTEKDELLYKAQSFKEKAGRLRRAGRTEEAQKALEESERYKKMADEWKPKEEFEERKVPVYNIGWHRASFFSGHGRNHSYDPGCLREIIEDNFEFLRDGLTKEEKRNWLVEYSNGTIFPKRVEERDNYGLGIYGNLEINGLMKMFQDVASHKDSEIIYTAWRGKETKIIEVRKDDENLWRVKGEKNWRRMPSKKDWGL